MYSVDMKTLRQIRKTEPKNRILVSADVIDYDILDGFKYIHSRTEMITDWDTRTGTEGAELAIMGKFNTWKKGGK